MQWKNWGFEMPEMRAIHFEKGEQKTQYALMMRKGNDWSVFSAIWAEHDDTAREKGAELVGDIMAMMPQYKNAVFTVMKMLSTNGMGDM